MRLDAADAVVLSFDVEGDVGAVLGHQDGSAVALLHAPHMSHEVHVQRCAAKQSLSHCFLRYADLELEQATARHTAHAGQPAIPNLAPGLLHDCESTILLRHLFIVRRDTARVRCSRRTPSLASPKIYP